MGKVGDNERGIFTVPNYGTASNPSFSNDPGIPGSASMPYELPFPSADCAPRYAFAHLKGDDDDANMIFACKTPEGANVLRSIILRNFFWRYPEGHGSIYDSSPIPLSDTVNEGAFDVPLPEVGVLDDGSVSPIVRVQVRDFTDDGLVDLVILVESGALYFLSNTGSQASPSWSLEFELSTSIEAEPIDLTVTDVDGDGLVDVLVMFPNGIRFVRNTGTANWPAFAEPEDVDRAFYVSGFPSCESGSNCPISLLAYDWFGRGHDELAVQLGINVFLFERATSQSIYSLDDVGNSFGLSLQGVKPIFSDFDNDSLVDVVSLWSDGTIEYSRNDGWGNFVQVQQFADQRIHPSRFRASSLESESDLVGADFWDLNNDGEAELVLTIMGTGLVVLENVDGIYTEVPEDDNPFASVQDIWSLRLPLVSKFVALDEAGLQILVSIAHEDEFVGVLLRHRPDFGRFGIFELAENPFDVRGGFDFGDVDNDGDEDFLTIDLDGRVYWQENTGSSNFENLAVLQVQKLGLPWYSELFIFDIDGDADFDLLSFYYSEIQVATNTLRDCASHCTGGRGTCVQGGQASVEPDFSLAVSAQGLASISDAPGKCICAPQFQGYACERCAAGRYGPDCSGSCPTRSTTSLAPGAFIYPDFPTIAECKCLSTFEIVNGTCTCPPGSGYNALRDACEICALGSFKATYGLHACSGCASGLWTFTSGQIECEPESCDPGYERDSSTQQCVECELGFYRENRTKVACFPCPDTRKLTLSKGSTSFQDCVSGPGFVVSANRSEPLACSTDRKLQLGTDCSVIGLTVERLPIRPHYWRVANTSLDVRACPHASYCEPVASASSHARLLASNETRALDAYCSPNHEGVLCASCEEGYALDGSSRCEPCDAARRSQDKAKLGFWVLTVLLVTSAPAFYIFFTTNVTLQTERKRAPNAGKEKGYVGRAYDSFRSLCGQGGGPDTLASRCVRSGRGKVLIVVKFAQIVVEVGSVVGLIGAGGAGASSVLNLNVGMLFGIIKFGCSVYVDQYDALMVVTLWPLICGATLVAGLRLCRWRSPASYTSARALSIRLYTELIVFLYPGISATIFSVFVYDSIYHYEGDEAPLRVLRADPAIDYDADASRATRAYAGIMILLYPLGVPALLVAGTYFLHATDGGDEEDTDKEDAEKGHAEKEGARLGGVRGVLVTAASCIESKFRKGYAWYACVELIRRLLLTSGFLLMLMAGFRAASIYFIFCNVVFLVAIFHFHPFKPEDYSSEVLEKSSQALLFILALAISAHDELIIGPTATKPVISCIFSLEVVAFCIMTLFGARQLAANDTDAEDPAHSESENEDIGWVLRFTSPPIWDSSGGWSPWPRPTCDTLHRKQ